MRPRLRSAGRRAARAAATLALVASFAPLTGGTAQADIRTFTDIGVTRDGRGYAIIAESGEVYAYGTVQYRGNPIGFTGRMVGIAVTNDGLGYVAISSAGQVYAYGTAVYRGNPTGFTGSIVDVSVTGDGLGYVAISSAGQVYAFGNTVYRGNPAGFTGSISSVSVTNDGQGYVALSTAGQVYAYNVVYRGNPTGFSGYMKSISVTNSGQGYVAMSTAGQMYAFNVVYRGNPTGFTGSMVGVGVTGDGQGYAATSSIGQVYAYGTVQYRGNGDPGVCHSDTCTGQDPITYGCFRDATQLEEFTDGGYRFQLMLSPNCHAAWTRVSHVGPTTGCGAIFAQIRWYDVLDNRLGVDGVAPCQDTRWTSMVSFRHFVRACSSGTWFDGEPRHCTNRY